MVHEIGLTQPIKSNRESNNFKLHPNASTFPSRRGGKLVLGFPSRPKSKAPAQRSAISSQRSEKIVKASMRPAVFEGASVLLSRSLVPPEAFDAVHDALRLNGAQVFLCCDPSRSAPSEFHVISSIDHVRIPCPFFDFFDCYCDLELV